MQSVVSNWFNGGNCSANCPARCGPEEMMCPEEMGPDGKMSITLPIGYEKWQCLSSGCPTAEFCMQLMNGDCPAHCPASCAPEDMICPGGSDWNGNLNYFIGLM